MTPHRSLSTISQIATPVRSAIIHSHSAASGPIKAAETARATGIPEVTVERETESLVILGLLRRAGDGTATILCQEALFGVISLLTPEPRSSVGTGA